MAQEHSVPHTLERLEPDNVWQFWLIAWMNELILNN